MEPATVTPAEPPRRRRGRPPQRGLAEQRRRQIVEAAYQVFAELGYERASVADVARHAGIGQGTIYRYFASKRELLDHVVDYGFELLLDSAGIDATGLPETAEAFTEQVRGLAERLFALFDEQPALLKLILLEINAIDAELKARLLGLVDMADGLTSSYLEHGRRAGWLRQDLDTRFVAHGALTMVTPGLLLMLRGEATPALKARYVDGLVDFVLHGMAVGSGADE